MALNFDPNLVPYPPYEFRLAMDKIDGIGQDDLGPRKFRGISWHRGVTGTQTLDGAVGYLIAPSTRGLTDGYIDNNTGRVVIMNPMAVLFPEVYGLVPNWEDRAGWANGPYYSHLASEDGRNFVNKFGARHGASVVNQDLESYEMLGNYGTPVSDKAKRVMAQIAANRAQRSKIPWDKWPINPGTGITEMFGHREFCGTAYKLCPGEVMWAFINGPMVQMVRDILRAAQVEGKRVTVAGVSAPAPAPAPTPKTFTIRFPLIARRAPGFWKDGKATAIYGDDGKPVMLQAGTTGTIKSGPVKADTVNFYDLDIPGFGSAWVQDQVLHTLEIKG